MMMMMMMTNDCNLMFRNNKTLVHVLQSTLENNVTRGKSGRKSIIILGFKGGGVTEEKMTTIAP